MIKMRWRLMPFGIACAGLMAPGIAEADTSSFAYTGAEQTFTVPSGVTSLHVVAVGGKGGGSGTGSGGFGAQAIGDASVIPGQVLYVEVGGNGAGGADNPSGACPGGAGGFNGGGNGGADPGSAGCPQPSGGGGGGASDVRTAPAAQAGSLDSRLIVAGGGGGAGNATAGGAAGHAGSGLWPGEAGTSTSGGAGGSYIGPSGGSGGKGQGGAGAAGNGGGGGGGGGLYGGGGGYNGSGASYAASGGGGGSSGFGSATSNTSVTANASGVPSVTFTYTPGSGDGAGGGGTAGVGGTGGGSGSAGGVGGAGGGSTSSFVLTKPAVSKSGRLTFILNAPGPGSFTASAVATLSSRQGAHLAKHPRSHTGKQINYGGAVVPAPGAGPVTLVLRPSGAARAAFAKGRRLTVLVTIKFTPRSGGASARHRTTVTVPESNKKHR